MMNQNLMNQIDDEIGKNKNLQEEKSDLESKYSSDKNSWKGQKENLLHEKAQEKFIFNKKVPFDAFSEKYSQMNHIKSDLKTQDK